MDTIKAITITPEEVGGGGYTIRAPGHYAMSELSCEFERNWFTTNPGKPMVVIAADNVTFHADPLLGAGNAYFADTEEKAVDIPCNLTLAFTMDSVQFSASEKDSDSLFGACSICLTAFVDNESLLKIRTCSHNFHVGCIRRWIIEQNKSTCPNCVRSVHSVHRQPSCAP